MELFQVNYKISDVTINKSEVTINLNYKLIIDKIV